MRKDLIKDILKYLGIIVLFIVMAYAFVPEVLNGKIVNQSDIASWKGMANEAITHNNSHPDDPTYWTNSMFGGMPTTATIDDFKGDWTDVIYDFFLLGERPASYILIALIGGFLLMLSLGTSKLIAVAGAIAIAFCSYNMQIIQVGHNTKMQAIAFFPWVMATVIFTYRAALDEGKSSDNKKWLVKTVLGATLFALALSMQIKANHVQITYYLAIVIFAFVIGLFIYLCINKERRRQLKKFFSASVLLLIIGITGIATNANKLIPTYEYSKYTMRGGSELTSDKEGHNNSGLDIKYATEGWSYGIEEMPNLMIPNYNGGCTYGELDADSNTGKFMKKILGAKDAKEIVKQMPLYHGPQRFTAGPMYMGAITVFLFVLGMLLCKGREKWWLLAAIITAVFLAWGEFFIGFTEFWFEYIPMYSKFRTVSMALIILQTALPMLGFYVLDRIMKETYEKKKLFKAGAIALALTAGFCLISILVPSISGSFSMPGDKDFLSMLFGIPADQFIQYGININDFCSALAADRVDLMKADATRSLVLILIVAVIMALPYYIRSLNNAKYKTILTGCIALLVLFDMWNVGKRYLNDGHFVTKKNFSSQYEPRFADKVILEDADPNYRVLDLSGNTFNNAIPSYHHKCIGGYSPVKLQRYQDLIDYYINREIREVSRVNASTIEELEENLPYLKVVSMLNGKYLIIDGNQPPVVNKYTFGNCWFVNDFIDAATPDEEIGLLRSTDVSKEAVIGKDYSSFVEGKVFESHPGDTIRLISYAPNELRYEYNVKSDRAAVFSEIFYPAGWKAWIESEGNKDRSVDIFRVDWMLRATVLPAGKGELVMRFEPESYAIGSTISTCSSIFLILLLIVAAGGMIFYKKL